MESANISVVIPAYNAESFIVEALNSIMKQSALPTEVIVIDDGSLDCTSDCVNRWIKNNHQPFNTILLRQTNGGISSARNAGIRKASSHWIALLDADDIWENNHLEILMAAVKLIPNAIGSYAASRLLVNGKLSECFCDDYWDSPSRNLGKKIEKTSNYLIDFNVFERLIKGNFIKPSCVLFDRSVAIQAGLFNESLRSAEDRDFFIRLLRLGNLVYSNVSITRYRWHDDNLSQIKNSKKNIENGLRALKTIKDNIDLHLNKAEFSALQQVIINTSREHSYASSLDGKVVFLKNMKWLAKTFGLANLLTAVSLKDCLRAMISA